MEKIELSRLSHPIDVVFPEIRTQTIATAAVVGYNELLPLRPRLSSQV